MIIKIKLNVARAAPLFLASAFVAAKAVHAQPAGEGDLRRAVALLDYVAADYGRAVGESGELLSAAEHEEQVGFVRDAAREVRSGAGAPAAAIAARMDALGNAVEERRPPRQVVAAARALREEIAQRFHVAILPSAPPDPGRGKALYAQSCAACHGESGHPPPPAQLPLSTRPVAFADPAQVQTLSPQRIFSGITYGVPKTAMPAFDDALDDVARWDLAFHVLTLAHPSNELDRGRALALGADLSLGYRALATLDDAHLEAMLVEKGLSEDERALALAAARAGPFAEEPSAGRGLSRVRREVRDARDLVHRGDRESARRRVLSAYLDHFEPVEAALRARDQGIVQEIEAGFLALRQAIDQDDDRPAAAAAPGGGAPPGGGASPRGRGGADAAAQRLDGLLQRAEQVQPGGSVVPFVAALAIALREGVEAALLIALLLALLRRSSRDQDLRAVHWGWSAALGGGVLTWWASGALLRMSGASREMTEGALQLLTAALLLYASHWVLAATSARRRVGLLSAKALSGGSALLVFWLAFGAVYREMFEVVVFLRGLLFESHDARPVLAGAVTGVLLLAVLVAIFQKLGGKLRPRPLLLVCGALLCGLAVLMVGKGVRALQAGGALPATEWGSFQLPTLGIYATREGLIGQLAVLFGLLLSALWSLLRRDPARKGTSAAAARA